MKTFVACFLFSVCCLTSYAQSYVPFPTTNAVWNDAYGFNGGSFSYLGSKYDFIDGDTVINNLQYHKVYSQAGTYYSPWLLGSFPPPAVFLVSTFTGIGTYNGAIREDSNKHIYYFPTSQNPPAHEYLLYDFNLQVGDTLSDTLYNVQQGSSYVVDSIDSIFDGFIYRKRYYLNTQANLIEGIGSSRGLTQGLDPFFEDWATLLCFSDTISKYTDPLFNLCSLLSINDNNATIKNLITIFPNPTSGFLNLKLEDVNSFPLELMMMDMQGKLILQKSITYNDDLSFDMKAFSKGEYFIAVRNKKSILFHEIIFKQ